MTSHRPAALGVAVALVAAVASGCGSSGTTTRHRVVPAGRTPTSQAPPVRSVASAPDLATVAYARAEVARLLSAFPAGPGWRRVPVSSTPRLAQSAGTTKVAAPTLVQGSQAWIAPGTQAQVLAYLRGHVPAGAAPAGTGRTSGPGFAPIDQLVFRFGAMAGRRPASRRQAAVIGSETLYESVTADAQEGVDIRVDAQVVWRPSRTALQTIPTGVTSVRIAVSSAATGPQAIREVTTTDPAEIARLRAVVDALVPVVPIGVNPGGLMVSATDLSWRVEFRLPHHHRYVVTTDHTPNGQLSSVTVDGRPAGPKLAAPDALTRLLASLVGPLPHADPAGPH